MDILHLPPALRRTLFTKSLALCRCLTTQTTTPNNDFSQQPPPTSQALLTLSPGTLNSYNLSTPPTPSNLKQATQFFTRSPPTLLFTTAHFRHFPPSPFPEVAFLGRSNVGKSSLLNALLGRPRDKPARVSKRPGRTRTMNGFGIGGEGMTGPKQPKGTDENNVDPAWKQFGRGGMIVVDMPGYGAASREEWGTEILKYLSNRKQLRRTYVLVDTEHGLKQSDMSLLLHLRQNGLPHQIVLSKVDKLLYPNSKPPGALGLHNRLLQLQDTCADIRDKLNRAAGEAGGRDDLLGDILCCSAEKALEERGKARNKRIGIDEIRWSVLTACGLDGSSTANKEMFDDSGEDEQTERYNPS